MKRVVDRHVEGLLAVERGRKGPPATARDRVRRRVRASILLPPVPPPSAIPHAPAPPSTVAPPPPVPPLSPAAPPSLLHTAATLLGTAGPVARAVAVAASIAAAGAGIGIATRSSPLAHAPERAGVALEGRDSRHELGTRGPRPEAPLTDAPPEPATSTPVAPAPSALLPAITRAASPPPSHPAPSYGAVKELPGTRAPDTLSSAATRPDTIPPGTLAAERPLLDSARGALRSGDADDALRNLDLHARRFPSGVLVEERDAMTIQALVAAGRTSDARAAGIRFRSTHPGSLLEPAVDDALESIP